MCRYRVNQHRIVLKLDIVSINKILVTKFATVKVSQNLNLTIFKTRIRRMRTRIRWMRQTRRIWRIRRIQLIQQIQWIWRIRRIQRIWWVRWIQRTQRIRQIA